MAGKDKMNRTEDQLETLGILLREFAHDTADPLAKEAAEAMSKAALSLSRRGVAGCRLASKRKDKTMRKETKFQDACHKFVEAEVLCLQTRTVETLQKHDEDFFDNVTNLSRPICPHCEEDVDHDVEKVAAPEDAEHGCSYQCPHCGEGFEDCELKDAEVYEWWAVTGWLARKLEERGEVIFDGPDCMVWGRQATGQAILLDDVIRSLVKEFRS
jgi:hypothetical protein